MLLALVLPLVLVLAGYLAYLDQTVRAQFEGKRWALPARVYARPLELFAGMHISPGRFEQELRLLHYREGASAATSGTYAKSGRSFEVYTRGFSFWDGVEPSLRVRLGFDSEELEQLSAVDATARVDILRLEPVQIGGIYPAHNEDRVLVRLGEVPPKLIETLIAVEDRSFYRHHGVDLRAIGRAVWVNLRSARVAQGGSTLTQQLVKNFFLTADRTVWRKVNEALMALLLEARYSKKEILEAYLNEIYLGQDGDRAIHGFGLASQHYFGRPLSELEVQDLALLVGMTRGPSYYNPRKHPRRATARRNLVLDVMAEQGVLDAQSTRLAKTAPLGVLESPGVASGRYPAFLDLVGRQLRRDYREEDLRSEGLRIFTTLDPLVQENVEAAVEAKLKELERSRRLPAGSLDAAVVVTGTQDGEVAALLGGRDPRFAGFNRALDAMRPIGSLAKPAVYLAALHEPGRFTVVTPLEDRPIRVRIPGAKTWSPENYDRRYHGQVALHEALAQSYNLATVHLGLEVGVDRVLDVFHALGIRRRLDPYPSVFLGAAELAPIEVAQMYQTLAAGGFYTPLRAIREVLDAEGQPLQRYPLTVERTLAAAPVYLVNTLLQEAAREGTGRAMYGVLPASLAAAGKTGTTNDLRDSWFAGFSGDRLMVVWVGRDDNQSTGLSGASGALRVWIDIMRRIEPQPLDLLPPADVQFVSIDPQSLLLANAQCTSTVRYPFISGSAPRYQASCWQEPPAQVVEVDSSAPPVAPAPKPAPTVGSRLQNWFKRLFE